MSKFPLNLSQFKKVKDEKDHAILEHPHGHTIKIAKKPLGDKMRKQLDALPMSMAKGGEVKKELEIEEIKEPKKKLDIEAIPEPKKKHVDYEEIKMAEGGEIPYDQIESNLAAENTPYGVPSPAAPTIPQQSPLQPPASPAMQSPVPASSAPVPPVVETSTGGLGASTQAPQPEDPSVMGGYNKQVAGIQGEAQAKSAEGKAAAEALQGAVEKTTQLATDYQTHYQDLDNERKAFVDDITAKHIDPNHYIGSMDTGRKFDTAVGLILGGFAGGGTSNQAQEFLNKQIDRDIAAQQSDIDKKQTLLGANLRQFGNMKDATDMTRVMMNDIVVNKLKMAEATAVNPLAKARAQQQIGQLEQAIAPMVQQLATRRMLQSLGSGGPADKALAGVDPATFVPSVVPESRQKDVTEEIKTAQNTRQITNEAMKNFDEVAKELSSVPGRVGVAVYSPAQLQALEAELGSTVGEKEGSVRETAMHNVKNAYLPRVTDTVERLANRRQKLVKYLQLKSATPTAIQYGIDLDKFESTTRKQVQPDTRAIEQWARANPNDPRAQLALKKLGIK